MITTGRKIPRWLCDTLDYGDGEKTSIPWLDYHKYLDHFETRKDKHTGKLEHISQPYDSFDEEDFAELIETCAAHHVGFRIRADSDHYPGRTLLIEWYLK